MIEIDLLRLDVDPEEGTMEAILGREDVELHFNGRMVWGDIVKAIVAGRRDIAASQGLPEAQVTPVNLDIALYHPEEKVLYVAVDYALPGRNSRGTPIMVRAERMIARGGEPRTVEISQVSNGTTAKMLELMDVIDLSRVMWLPLRS
jgi:hypothetical protein